jgi:hypothetical protein
MGRARRVAAIAMLTIATVATWQVFLPAVETGQDQTTQSAVGSAPPTAPRPIKGVGGVYTAVLNITGTNGAAGAAAANLEARGVHVSYVGNGVFTNHPTTVLYQSGAKRPAQALAQAFHLPAPKPVRARLAPSIGIARIVVLVGPEGIRG